MKWFKHYSNASESDALTELNSKHGIAGLGRYWKLIEVCSHRWDTKKDPTFTLDIREMRVRLQYNTTKQLRRYLEDSHKLGLILLVSFDHVIVMSLPKLSEIFHRDAIGAGLRRAHRPALDIDREVEVEVDLDKKRRAPASPATGPPKKLSTLPILTELVSYWNSFPQLPKVKAVSKERKRKFKERFKEQGDKEKWTEAIKKISESDFCLANNDRGWVATFDWLLQPDTWVKVLEGKYDNRGHKNKLTHADRVSEGNKELFEKFRGDT